MLMTLYSRTWRGVVLVALLLSLLNTAMTPSPARAEAAPSDRTDDDRQHSPLVVEVSMAKTPAVNKTAKVTIVVSSTQPASGVRVDVVTSEGMRIDGEHEFVIDLAANGSQTLTTRVTPEAAGNHKVAANVRYDLGGDNVWGDSDVVYFSSGDGTSAASFAFAGDPMSGGASPGPGNNTELRSEAFADGTMTALAHDDETLIPVDTGEIGGQDNEAPTVDAAIAAGTLTIRGNTGMFDQRGYWKDQMLLVELLYENGVTITWTYSDVYGNYAFTVGNPGKFRIRVWANYYHSSMSVGAIRVVGKGLQTPNRFSMAGWHYNIPTMGPFANGEVNVGSWGPASDWDGRRAWWIYQDLIDAFTYTWDKVPSGVPAGSRQPDGVTAEWEPGSTDGTYYRRDERRIHLADVDANSAHTVLHEYGHAVMHNVYGGYFPVNDCPSRHYVSQISGTNCSWTEGWADFFSIVVLYDPVYKWGCALPCTPDSLNLEETHVNPLEFWDDGDLVEGNVAASLWDFIDPYVDGLDKTNSAITPFTKIWDIFWNYNHDQFSQFWVTFSTNVNYNNAVATLYQNTIDYGWPQCQDSTTEPDDNPWMPVNSVDPATGPYRRVLCTDFDVDYFRFDVVAGGTYTIETMGLGTALDGSTADTTLVLFSMSQFGGLTQLAYDDNSGSQYLTSRIVQTAATDGVYYVAVRQANSRGDFGYGYGIDVTAANVNVAPTVTAPTHQLAANQTLGNPSTGAYTVNVKANWTASDPDDGIASQSLRRQVNNAGFVAVTPSPSKTARSANITSTIGTNNQLQVSATDVAGATSGYVTGADFDVVGTQQTGFTYSGSWANASAASAWGGSYKRATGASDVKAFYTFNGTSVALVGLKRSDGGRARVYVDGVSKGTVDFYSATARDRQVLFTVNGLSAGGHTMELRWINAHNSSSTGYRLYLDGGIALD
jgi:hypothetical protein